MAYQSTMPGRFVFVFLALAVGCSQLPLDSGDAAPIDPDAGSEGGASGTGGVAAGGQGGQGAVTLIGGNQQGGAGTGGAAMGGAGTGGTAMGGMVTGGNAAGGAGTGGTAMGGAGAGGTAVGGMNAGGTAMGGTGGCPAPYRCSGSTSQMCVNGTFSSSQNCSLGCNVDTGKCNVCMPSKIGCSINMRSACSADGQTETRETCDYGCLTGSVDCRECASDGDIECPTSTSVRTCTMGRLTPNTMCPGVQVCSAGKGCGCPSGTGLLDGECLSLEGYYVPFNYSTSIGPGFFSAQRITVNRGGIVRALGIVGQRASSRVRMGLYRDASGSPGTLLVESVIGDVASGLTFYKTTSWPTITAGAYWLGAVYESTGQVLRELDNAVPYRSLAHAFTKPLLTNLSGTTSTASPNNYFVVIE